MFTASQPADFNERCCSLCGIVSLFSSFSYSNIFGDESLVGIKKFYSPRDDIIPTTGASTIAHSGGLIPSEFLNAYKAKAAHANSDRNYQLPKSKPMTDIPVFETVSTLTNWKSSNAHGEHMLPKTALRLGIFHDMNYFLSVLGVKFVRSDQSLSQKKRAIRWDKSVVAQGENHLRRLCAECQICLQRLDYGGKSMKIGLGMVSSCTSSQTPVPSPKKSIGTASTVMLSPRQFRSALRAGHEESEIVSDSGEPMNNMTVQTIVGRPFHRSKLLSMDVLSSDSSNSSSQLSDKLRASYGGSNDRSDHSSSRIYQDRNHSSDLQVKAIRSLQQSRTESNLTDTSLDNSVKNSTTDVTSSEGVGQCSHTDANPSQFDQLMIMNLKQKIDITLALSEVMQLEGDTMEATNIMVKLLNEIVVARDNLSSLKEFSSSEDVDVANLATHKVNLLSTVSDSTNEYQWNILLSVCHRRLGTLFKILCQFDKAEWHLMEYFKCIQHRVFDRSECFPEQVNTPRVGSIIPPAPADICCAYAILSLVLEQLGGREIDAAEAHRKSILIATFENT